MQNADDVGVRKATRRLRLALETHLNDAVVEIIMAQNLEGHVAVEHPVARLVDDPHAPRAENRLNFKRIVNDRPEIRIGSQIAFLPDKHARPASLAVTRPTRQRTSTFRTTVF